MSNPLCKCGHAFTTHTEAQACNARGCECTWFALPPLTGLLVDDPPGPPPGPPPVPTSVECVIRDATNQLRVVTEAHGPFASAHEAVSIIREELDELWDEVRKKEGMRNRITLRNEAIDVAVGALRFAAQIHGEVYDGKRHDRTVILNERWLTRIKALEARELEAIELLTGKAGR